MTKESTSSALPIEDAIVSNALEVRSGLTLLHQSCTKNYSKIAKMDHGLSLDFSAGVAKAERCIYFRTLCKIIDKHHITQQKPLRFIDPSIVPG